ncbi:MAG TPA: hypothetical protein VLG39_11250 [Nitrospirota bacterium]|nr:hypothetical protein [Nitrospirota bacterium]
MKKIVIAVLLGVSLFNPSSVLAADIENGFMAEFLSIWQNAGA